MIDLETLSTRTDAAIVEIGACTFSKEKGVETMFEVGVKADVGHIKPATVMWWLSQEEQARLNLQAAFQDGKSTARMLEDFMSWVAHNTHSPQDVTYWAKPAAFDLAILRYHADSLGFKDWPSFRQDRCMREWMKGRDTPQKARSGTAHRALDDAISQAEWMLAAGFDE